MALSPLLHVPEVQVSSGLQKMLILFFAFYSAVPGAWLNCWVSVDFLHAPIPRKGSGSITTTLAQDI